MQCGTDISKILFELELSCFRHEIAATEHVDSFASLIKDNPIRAIRQIKEVYDKSLNQAYTDPKTGKNARFFVEAMAGGPLEIIPRKIYNAIGAAYPLFDRATKDAALHGILSILDYRNYQEVQMSHTNGIREPLLLSDIVVVRGLYWPGLESEAAVIKRYTYFHELWAEISDGSHFNPRQVESDFLFAYALLRSGICSWGEEFVEVAEPRFLDRAIKSIVAIWFHKGKHTKKEIREIMPESTHQKIDQFIKERDWADWEKFK